MKKLIYVIFSLVIGINSFATLNTSVSVNKSQALIGDKVVVEIKAITTENKDISFELNLKDDDSFTASKPEKTTEQLPDNYTMVKLTFNIFPFKLEEINPGEVTIIQGDEKVSKVIPTIKVVSVFENGKEKQEINPIKGQLDIKPDYTHVYRYGLYFLIGIILLFISYFLIKKLLKKFKKKEEQEEDIILDPPCIEIKNMLSALLSSHLLKEGKVKEFFIELSEIGKRFLGRTFDFDYQFQTTEEIYSLMKEHVNMAEERQIKEFFQTCDLVKFAKVIPAQGGINATVNIVYKFVEMICERLSEKENKNVSI